MPRIFDNIDQQLTLGAPTDANETGLPRLATQIRAGKVIVRLRLLHPLHGRAA